MKKVIYFLLLGLTASIANAAYFFEDGFESGDQFSTNSQGFEWTGSNGWGIFNDKGMIWKNDTGALSPAITSYSSKTGKWAWAKDSNTQWKAKTGSKFMNTIFSPAKGWAEPRFDLGTPIKDVWIRYWMRVPPNFYQNKVGDCNSNGAYGDKFFALWQDGYSTSGDGSTIIWGKVDKERSPGDMFLNIAWSPGYNSNVGNDKTPGGPSPSGEASFKLINYRTDRGKWMQIVMHIRLESADGAKDGLLETYRRWADESSFKRIQHMPNANIRSGKNAGVNGFKKGYIMGASNYGYCEQTEWLFDDFTVSDQPLLNDTNVTEVIAPPRPPTVR